MTLQLGPQLDAQHDPNTGLATDVRLKRVSGGADDLGLQALYFDVCALPADRQLARYDAGESAGPVGGGHRQSVGVEVHDQRQHGDELLAGGAGSAGGDFDSAVQPA